jgi:hypothetical protein
MAISLVLIDFDQEQKMTRQISISHMSNENSKLWRDFTHMKSNWVQNQIIDKTLLSGIGMNFNTNTN